MKVAVIGSGLSAVGAIRALVKQGIRPEVLDWGEELDKERASFVAILAAKSPDVWSQEERERLCRNDTVRDGSSIPRKLIFGSSFFYGASRKEAPILSEGNTPPLSYAKGGLSVGWGAAVMAAQDCDLQDWPLDAGAFSSSLEALLAELPYSAVDDELSYDFPIHATRHSPLDLSEADAGLLDALRRNAPAQKGDTLYGQARLLVSSPNSGREDGCRACGQCMSGCVYKSIYKANDEIRCLHEQGKIVYRPHCLVTRLSEGGGEVTITYIDGEGRTVSETFDKVFLAAGAVNSTRIVLTSLEMPDVSVRLKTRGGFVLPVFSFGTLRNNWPRCNTQPGIFIELKGEKLKHWVHVQLSTMNELLLQKLGIHASGRGMLSSIKRFVANHLALALVNYHSDHSGEYELWMSRKPVAGGGAASMMLNTRHRKRVPQLPVLLASCGKLLRLFLKVGMLPVFPAARLNSGSYHVGGSLPMRAQPSGPLETDVLGRVSAWRSVHIVDTSVFPSLPGTTIGLLAMANAYRIVESSMKEVLG